MRLGANEIWHVEEPKFTKQCSAYFEKNFKKLAEDEPLSLPWKTPEDYMEIEGIMADWCKETNELSSVKGLILHKFSLTRCLELYGIEEDTIRDYLRIGKFSKAPICVTYNPHQKAILLIRKAESDDLATDMALCRNDLKMFILLFNDELRGSGVKLIPLVVSDGKPKVDCDECLNHVLSESKFKPFASLWKKKYFQTKPEGKFKKDFSNDFLVKATSLMAATYIKKPHDCIPKFTSRTCEEMNNLAVLLTREQLEIFYSQDKHMIVKGGYGCGKTIVADAILQKISENLGEHEKLFFICYDSRSALINYMIKDKQVSEVCYDSRSALKNYMIKYDQGREVAKVVKFHNKEGLPLSQIIKDILEIEKYPEKVNFIVDEYDGEDLDKSEANALNNMLSNTDSLKDAFLMLIAQPIEKERTLNNIQRSGNMFHLLKTMKTHELTLVMRNSTEIHKLAAATKTMLSEEKTVYFHEDDSKADQEEKASQIITSGNSAKEIQEVSESPHNEVTSREDRRGYLEEIPKLGIDEAQAITGSFAEIVSGGSKTVTKFTYAPADETGHNINSKRPALFELEEGTRFQKVLSLIAIFEGLDIRNKRHVLLHFDTANDEIPSTLQFIFEHHFGIREKVTNNYQEFASLQKSILVCSYRTFRGLEHQRIIVVIDRDIYYLQHYLVESLSRCTSKLRVVVLQNSATLTKVTDEWKKKQLVDQWKTICNKDTQKKNFVSKEQKDDKVINGTFKCEYYGKLEEIFNALPTSKDESKMKSFAKNLLEEKG